jgi:transposase InsO family protein
MPKSQPPYPAEFKQRIVELVRRTLFITPTRAASTRRSPSASGVGKPGVRPSMGSVGDAYDNALCESFFATLECELLDRHRFRTQLEARQDVFDFIEGWYNPRPGIPASTTCRPSPMRSASCYGVSERSEPSTKPG